VFWLFLGQALSADHSCRETVRRFLGWLALGGRRASARTTGYCKARGRLRQEDLDEVLARLSGKVRAVHGPQGGWFGRAVKVVDGSGLSMPDTRANQKRWGQPAGTKPGCSFPVMRVVALFCLGTGALIGLSHGSLRVHERTLLRALWDLLEPGDVVLADRGFCGFAEAYSLLGRGVDSVMRNHPRRTVGKTRLKRLGRGDFRVLWHKSQPGPNCPDKALWHTFPDTLTLREISFRTGVRGFRTRVITVVTTRLDPVAFPTEAFAGLYRRRWQAELFLRDIKTTMGMDILTCKSPDSVLKELTMHLIAYTLVRLTMLEAAAPPPGAPGPRSPLSFKGTLSTLRQWAPLFAPLRPHHRNRLWSLLLRCIADDPLPLRPNRREPRARKRRPKAYQLLNKPRHAFKEIPHRSKYVKPLS
jgi:hypothetical protein